MIGRATRSFGKRIALFSFIQTPTIAYLAQLLSGDTVSHIAVVNKGSANRIPLIWVAPEPFQPRLAAHLSPEQPVLSCVLSQEELASTAPEYRLEDLATRIVHWIRQLQPGKSYALAGFCQAALLAYECAQQLKRLGCDVPLLVMGDVLAPGYLQNLSRAERYKRRLEREAFYLSTITRSGPSDWKQLLKRRLGGLKTFREERKWERFHRSAQRATYAVQELYEALLVGQLSYVPSPYSGHVLFLQSGDRPQSDRWDSAASWADLIGEQEVFEAPGDHTSIFEEPHVRVAARRLQDALDSAVGDMMCSSRTHQ